MNSNGEHPYQQCTRCVMDTTASDITFDEQGVCNYCTEFLERSAHILYKDPDQRQNELDQLIKQVKLQGKGKSYDCIVGVSGGVDSSWVLVKVVELGLRPLAVHMDNGWNSELAQNNIANLVNGLGVDLYTHVIDWHEYKSLMQAFFDAHVIDIELLYDNAMLAVNYQQAEKYKLKYILAGTNQATEGMIIPNTWRWFKYDKRNIRSIGHRFTNTKLVTFPSVGTIDFIKNKYLKGILWNHFLDKTEYNKSDVLDILQKKYNYKPYPYKHYESIFTRFYQGHILPEKFNVDKRRVHLSTLIISGQITRQNALEILSHPPYKSEKELQDDISYFLKKMNWDKQVLEKYLMTPEIAHDFYPSEENLWLKLQSILNIVKRNKL